MSRYLRRVELDPPGSVVTIGPKKAAPRALDFVTWRAYLAAPGSRFDAEPSASQQIVRLVTISQPADSSEAERRTA